MRTAPSGKSDSTPSRPMVSTNIAISTSDSEMPGRRFKVLIPHSQSALHSQGGQLVSESRGVTIEQEAVRVLSGRHVNRVRADDSRARVNHDQNLVSVGRGARDVADPQNDLP